MKTHLLSLGAGLLARCLLAAPLTLADYTAHEWGTFTSVQGADGVQIDWNPLLTSELPGFVYDRTRPLGNKPGATRASGVAGKTGTVSRQRLETPVIYFYSDTERLVDVSVDFPEGSVTEWYPQQNPLPRSVVRKGEPAARWEKVRVLAADAKVPALRREAAGSHYYAARETDANPVQMGAEEVEKFLFYRGVGRFMAPLHARLEGEDARALHLANAAPEPLTDLFIYEVSGDRARFVNLAALKASAPAVIDLASRAELAPLAGVRRELEAAMEAALVRAGLYSREAAAMVKTWDDSWFAEPGLRVLYVLPRAWTDRVLPVTLTPLPKGLERVMVGRAELITPKMERSLFTEIEAFRTGDEGAKTAAIARARALGLGRFAEPTVRRLSLADPKNREFGTAAWELLWSAFGPSKPADPLAAR